MKDFDNNQVEHGFKVLSIQVAFDKERNNAGLIVTHRNGKEQWVPLKDMTVVALVQAFGECFADMAERDEQQANESPDVINNKDMN